MKEPVVRFQDILEAVTTYAHEADIPLLRKAYIFAAVAHRGQVRKSGLPYLSHPLAVTRILTDLRMDIPALCGGLLHDVIEDCMVQETALARIFGEEIVSLVTGLTKTSRVTLHDRKRTKLENYRKMIIAMSKDIRILMIKLADRLHNMRTLESLTVEQQKRISEETLAIYAPLANRLGISWMRVELEDLSFRYIQPEKFEEIRKGVEERVKKKQTAMETIGSGLKEQLKKEGIPCEISGRVKHFYSVYRKLERQGIDLDQVFDLVALRVIVPEEKHCYQVLGLAHASWTPIPARFKDYIAQPKMNGYRTLHTTVSGLHGDCVEIQIRTRSMHRAAEQGVASHWM
jgi:GTP diphosphokinase / guanosine-3',5'-bis(diphosphate) 3'-diphosphatase